MMGDRDSNTDNFKVVTHRKKSSRKVATRHTVAPSTRSDYSAIDKESIVRRINTAKEEVLQSDIYASARASLREGLEILNQPKVTKIVCFGLGRIGECTIARYQLALLLCLRDLCNVEVEVYDPVFSQTECDVLREFNCVVLSDNCEGKYVVVGCDTTVFYLPHCPKQLSNNLLWANWGLGLSKCIIIANSFTKIIENTPARFLAKFAQYISKISPYMTELAVINNFKFYEVFNDTAIHIFPPKDMVFISEEFWVGNNKEPQYSDDDVEFVTNNQGRYTPTGLA